MSKLALALLPKYECASGWCPDLDPISDGLRELGQWDSNGEYDLAQFRFFNKPWTMEELLMIDDQSEYQDIWHNLLENEEEEENQFTGQFVKFNEWDMWYDSWINEDQNLGLLGLQDNEMPKYPINYENIKYVQADNKEVNSCVGLLFIIDDPNIERMESCLVEYNAIDITGATLHDGSGNDNRGILTGDYKVSKSDYGMDITRDDPANLAKLKTSKQAF